MGAERLVVRAAQGLRPPKTTLARGAVVVGLLVGLGLAHRLGGSSIGLYTFFVVPCVFAAWAIGPAAGFLSAASSAGILLLSDFETQVGPSQGALLLNAALRLGLYSLVSWGTHTIGTLLEQLQELSRLDPLTGLANRRELFARGADEIGRSGRTQRPFSVVFIDLDNFKVINDLLGHAAGDVMLKRVGDVLKAKLRQVDVPARLGGDEFAVLLPETDGDGALRAALALRAKLRIEAPGVHGAVTASIGAATFTQPPATFEEAVSRADELMYLAKKESKGTVIQKTFPTA